MSRPSGGAGGGGAVTHPPMTVTDATAMSETSAPRRRPRRRML